MLLKKDIIITNGPSINDLMRSFNKHLDRGGNNNGADGEVFFYLLMPEYSEESHAIKYVGKVTGLVHCHEKHKEKSAIFNVYGVFHQEGQKWPRYRVQIDRYNTRSPRCSGYIVEMRRFNPEENINPKTRKKRNSRPRDKRER